jgi:Spy/CpxP family protein refolding chaperone
MKARLASLVLALCCTVPLSAQTNTAIDAEAAYTRTIQERADKIVAALNLTNYQTTAAVRDILTGQYRDLRSIQDERDAAIRQARAGAESDSAEAKSEVQAAEDEARRKTAVLHPEFLARLSQHLNSEQVDQVKDGLTYNVLSVTYNAYMKMYPDLKDEQKAQIRAWLVEARELAMDQGSARDKHAVFGKYKGRINNYLSKAGYDLKRAEQNLKQKP